jgi:hypothetical protein
VTIDWGPWSGQTSALAAVFDLPTFADQVRALLDLQPKAMAKEILALPWEEKHSKAEVQRIRADWEKAGRKPKPAPIAPPPEDERPIEDRLWEQVMAHSQIGAFAEAKKAHELLVQIGKQKTRGPVAKEQDDFKRLDANETAVLAALVHKLRGEPLTPADEAALRYVALLEAP